MYVVCIQQPQIYFKMATIPLFYIQQPQLYFKMTTIPLYYIQQPQIHYAYTEAPVFKRIVANSLSELKMVNSNTTEERLAALVAFDELVQKR